MYSDLFDQLGRGASRSSAASEPVPEPPLVAFKAGKMLLERKPTTDSTFQCTADTSRGEVRLFHSDAGVLQWQWYDRRSESVKETLNVAFAGATFERIALATGKLHEHDRIYVLTLPKTAAAADDVEYKMYWMQDADFQEEEETVALVNQYLAEAAATNNPSAATSANTNTAAVNNSQVDALSSILENLGMPQAETTATSSTPSTNQLTLADLQGAMAGIAQQQQQQVASGPPLEDVVTQQAIDALLQDEGARQRLVQLLPEGQQSEEFLRENLQSAQMQSTLRALTHALLPDDHGDLSGYASVVANFQLDAAAGQDALAQGNPIQAFLDCIVASVENEKDDDEEEEKEESSSES